MEWQNSVENNQYIFPISLHLIRKLQQFESAADHKAELRLERSGSR